MSEISCPSSFAAKFLNVQPETLRNWRWQKKHLHRYFKIGKEVQYFMSDLEELKESMTIRLVNQ